MGNVVKKDQGYETAVGGAKAVIRILVYVFILLLIFIAGRWAYSFGYKVFDQKTMALTEDSAREETIMIQENDSVHQIGKVLENHGLIQDADVFWMQEKLSDHHGKIKPGTYILNTFQTVDEMLEIMSGEPEEEQ